MWFLLFCPLFGSRVQDILNYYRYIVPQILGTYTQQPSLIKWYCDLLFEGGCLNQDLQDKRICRMLFDGVAL